MKPELACKTHTAVMFKEEKETARLAVNIEWRVEKDVIH